MNTFLRVKRLEIIAYNIEACQIASSAGADRIELCDNPGDGGTTPSWGMVSKALEISNIPVFPMVRPRGGDFLYTDLEIEIMRHDINVFRKLGCKGVVFGLLNKDGTVNLAATQMLVEAAGDMEVTFHRAFDRVIDPVQALEAVISSGCKRILTSGCFPTAPEGIEQIRKLRALAGERIIIMPGSGVRSTNIKQLMDYTGCMEMHSSAGKIKDSLMEFHNPNMAERLTYPIPDALEVMALKNALQSQDFQLS